MIYDPLISSFSFRYEIKDGVIDFSRLRQSFHCWFQKIRIKGTKLKLKTHLGKNGFGKVKSILKTLHFFQLRR